MTLATQITDHVQQAKDLLLVQLKDSQTVNDLLGALVQEIQTLEDLFWEILNQRALANAVGSQLDGIGALLGVPRNNTTDAVYRLRIQARIQTNLSSGTAEEIIDMLLRLTEVTAAYLALSEAARDALDMQVFLKNYYPGEFIAELTGLGFTTADVTLLGLAIADITAAGVRSEVTMEVSGASTSVPFKYATGSTIDTSSTYGFGAGSFTTITGGNR